MNSAASSPRKTLSAGRKALRSMHRQFEGWTPALRDRVASQVDHIRHWKVIEGSFERCPQIAGGATWFVDPPYNNRAGSHYVHHKIDFARLADWCRSRTGRVLVCENEGADWLPFRPFATFKAGINGEGSREVLWDSCYPRKGETA